MELLIDLKDLGAATQSYIETQRWTVHEHCTRFASVKTGLCLRFVLCPPKTNPIWPWERATAGVSRRALSQGAPRGHRGITLKLWQGYPPICCKKKCCPMTGHLVDWCSTAVGRQRQTESSMPAAASLQWELLGVSMHTSFALSGLFKSCSQASGLYLLHICIYMRASI